jgi:alpha-L-fucosidase 2
MKLNRRTVLQAAAATTLLNSTLGRAASQEQRPNGADDLLWYAQPAQEWVVALPVGNGRIGAMIFGGVNKERLQLNDDTLWAGGPYDPANPDARAALPEVRRLIFNGEYEKATDLVTAKVMGKPLLQMAYQTIGDLELASAGIGAAVDYRRTLDLDGSLATTRFTSNGVAYTR